jgi:hypothetical protein
LQGFEFMTMMKFKWHNTGSISGIKETWVCAFAHMTFLNIIKIFFSVDLNGWIQIIFKEFSEYYARFELSSIKI